MKIKDETIAMLRKELKQFKEDAATFASNRAMYTTRNEELKAKVSCPINSNNSSLFQNEQLQEELNKAKEEHTILSQLLRMAIHQKLMANQRAADLEMSVEHPVQGPKRPIRQTGSSHPAHQREPRTVRYPQQAHNNNNQNGSSRGPRQQQ